MEYMHVCAPGVSFDEMPLFFVLSAMAECTPSRSQSGEETTYMRHFMPNRVGTFVELGALDGHTYSNTRVLNKCRGWSGLLLEANLQNYVKLLTNLDRENVKVVHSAVCEPPEAWANFNHQWGCSCGRHIARLGKLSKKVGSTQPP